MIISLNEGGGKATCLARCSGGSSCGCFVGEDDKKN